MSTPCVSVVMPAHNSERFIEAALRSIVGQRFTDLEIIVIDDGSNDATAARVRAVCDPRIRLLRHETNLGIPRTRNRGVEAARGTYLAWMDSDDVAHRDRIGRQVAFLESAPDHALVGSYARWIDARGRRFGTRRRPLRCAEIRARLLFRSCFTNTSVMVRRAVAQRYRYREDFALGSDVELFSRLAMDHAVANLPELLVDHRSHPWRSGGERRRRASTIDANKARVVGSQLDRLGVSYTATDLERHLALRAARYIPRDRDYAQWAERWLRILRETNRRARRYPTREFERALGERWLLVCYRAALPTAPALALRSPLSRLGVAQIPRLLAERSRPLRGRPTAPTRHAVARA